MNHVGYELTGPKRFVCRSAENLGPSGRFEVIDGTGRTLLEGTTSRLEPADSGGPWHYPGDFSAFREAGGDFRVRFEAGGRIDTSRPFGVGSSILRRLTMPLALQFLRSRRFGRANYRGTGEWMPPGVLPEDEHFYDVGGGWFDVPTVAEASMRTGARVMWALFLAHTYGGTGGGKDSTRRSKRRREETGYGPQVLSMELRELRRSADWLGRLMIRYPKSGTMISRLCPDGKIVALGAGSGEPRLDSEPHWALLAGFLAAKLSEVLADNELLRRGELFWEGYHEGLGGTHSREAVAAMLMSETALHVATLEPTYLASAERRVRKLLDEVETEDQGGPPDRQTSERVPDAEKLRAWETPGISMPVAALVEFAGSFAESPFTPRAKEAVSRFLDARVEAAGGDPFGLVPHRDSGEKGARGKRKVPEEDQAILRAGEAWQALAANRVTGRPAYSELATDAMNWILGLNAEDTCLVVGAGSGGRESWAVPAAEMGPAETGPEGAGETEGAVLGSPGSNAASAHTGTAATYLMALALI